jgi:hypothetical protein
MACLGGPTHDENAAFVAGDSVNCVKQRGQRHSAISLSIIASVVNETVLCHHHMFPFFTINASRIDIF